MNHDILVTICARKGSKGLRNKNLLLLAGQPLIVHTIRQALNWGRAAKVVVSTDSEEIAGLAKTKGAEIPFTRPPELSGDRIGKVAVIRHALIEAEKVYNHVFSIVVDLDVTAPFRSREDLDACLELYEKHRPKTLISAVPCRKNPYFNMVERGPHGRVQICKKPPSLVNSRQNAPEVFEINAAIYFYSRDYLMDEENQSALSDNSLIYEMPRELAVDIDSAEDLKYVEYLIQEEMLKL